MTTTEWRCATFQELINDGILEIGDGYRAKNSELGGNGPIFLRAGHVTDSHIDFEGVERFLDESSEKLQGKMAQVGDTIITTKGNSTGRTSYVTDGLPPFVYSPHLSYWRSKDKKCLEGGFLRYWSKGAEFVTQLRGMSTSTDMAPYLSLTDQRRVKITLPTITHQRAVSEILGTIDDKIELNRRMNGTLEGMARALFQSWFVDFDPVRAKQAGRAPANLDPATAALFPDDFEPSELGEIPKGWTVDSIKNVASNIQYGFTQSASEDAVGPRFLRITDIRGGRVNWKTVPFCPATSEECSKYRVLDGDIFVARTGASTGDNVYVIEPPEAVFASYLVRLQFEKRGMGRFTGEFMRTEAYASHVAGTLGGSAQPNASAQALAGARTVFPTDQISDAFYELLRPLDLKRAANDREANTLAALRDALLPKLLSGELSVAAAEDVVDAMR